MSVKYSWSRQNGAAVPPVRFMSIEPAEDYYKGMPLKLKENGIVEPTDGDPEYICMAQYDPDAEIQPLEIPVQEVFPDVIYEKINNDGTTEEVRFGSRGGGVGIKTVNGQKPDANGNVEVTAGVQSDMYETDPESMAFVRNNPIESGVVELAFDGTLEGKEYRTLTMDDLSLYYVKMSDEFISNTDIVSVKLNNDGTGVTDVEYTDDIYEPLKYGYKVGENIEVVENPTTISNDESTAVLDRGVWFAVIDASIMGGTGWMGGLGLTYKAKKVKTSLIPTHSHKWNDISDAPFYDRSKSEPLNITWDGDLTGRENFPAGAEDSYMVKVSDVVLSMEQLVGSTISYLSETGNKTLEITEDLIFDVTSQGMPMYSVDANLVIIVLEDIYQEGMSITKGVWFSTFGNGAAYTKSLSNPNVTITTGELKKIDPKFYDQPCYDSESVGDLLWGQSWNIVSEWAWESIKGTENVQLIDGQKYIVVWDGIEYKLEAKQIPNSEIILLGSCHNLYGITIDNNTPFGIMHGFVQWGNSIACETTGDHSFELYPVISIPVPLPEKFMPELTQVVLISPSGKKFKTTVGDDGVLITTEV